MHPAIIADTPWRSISPLRSGTTSAEYPHGSYRCLDPLDVLARRYANGAVS